MPINSRLLSLVESALNSLRSSCVLTIYCCCCRAAQAYFQCLCCSSFGMGYINRDDNIKQQNKYNTADPNMLKLWTAVAAAAATATEVTHKQIVCVYTVSAESYNEHTCYSRLCTTYTSAHTVALLIHSIRCRFHSGQLYTHTTQHGRIERRRRKTKLNQTAQKHKRNSTLDRQTDQPHIEEKFAFAIAACCDDRRIINRKKSASFKRICFSAVGNCFIFVSSFECGEREKKESIATDNHLW